MFTWPEPVKLTAVKLPGVLTCDAVAPFPVTIVEFPLELITLPPLFFWQELTVKAMKPAKKKENKIF